MKGIKRLKKIKMKNGRTDPLCEPTTHCTNCLNAMHFHGATVAQCAGPNPALLFAAY